jgi:hypothetical protein
MLLFFRVQRKPAPSLQCCCSLEYRENRRLACNVVVAVVVVAAAEIRGDTGHRGESFHSLKQGLKNELPADPGHLLRV